MSEVDVPKEVTEEEATDTLKGGRRKLQKKDLKSLKKCLVMGCASTSVTEPSLRFCIVPRNTASNRFKKWADFAQNPAIFEFGKTHYVCEKHFSPAVFSRKGGTKISKHAFPTIDGPCRTTSSVPSSSIKGPKGEDFTGSLTGDYALSDDQNISTATPKKRTYRKKSKIFTIQNIKKKVNNKTPKNLSYLLPDHGYFAQKIESEDEDSEYDVLDENQATERISVLMEKVEKLKMENFKMSRELKALREETYSMSVFSSPDEYSDTGESDDDDYEFLNKKECQERIEQLSDKVQRLLKEVVELKKENVLLKVSVKHLKNIIESLRQCGKKLIIKAGAISQEEFVAHQKEKKFLETKLMKVTEELVSTKEENEKLKKKIEELQPGLKKDESVTDVKVLLGDENNASTKEEINKLKRKYDELKTTEEEDSDPTHLMMVDDNETGLDIASHWALAEHDYS